MRPFLQAPIVQDQDADLFYLFVLGKGVIYCDNTCLESHCRFLFYKNVKSVSISCSVR